MSLPRTAPNELVYTHGYYAALSPGVIATALESRGLRAPDLQAPLCYFELGMGFGVSLLANAASFPHMRFFGNDFNPAHVAYARDLARDAGLGNVDVFEDGFEELLDRDLPAMDIIVMHGVYSWVSPALRQAIVRFVERRLKPGGVVYVSYNALPGWAPLLPLRELFHLHAAHVAAPDADAAGQLQGALDFIHALSACGQGYLQSHPAVQERLRHAQAEGPHYALHEYVGPDSHPLYFHQVASEFAPLGLAFAAPAVLAEQVDSACLSEGLRDLLASTPDPVLRETLRDYGLDRSFRRDLFVRGAAALSPADRAARLLEREWVLAVQREAVPQCAARDLVAQRLGEGALNDVLDALAAAPARVRDLLSRPALGGLDSAALHEALMLLASSDVVMPALPAALRAAARAPVQAFNAAVLARGGSDGTRHLVSGASGLAVEWSAPALWQIRAAQRHAGDPQAIAREMVDAMGGPEVQDFDAMAASAQRYLDRRAPLLRRLEVL
ncbi:class I SAM-dependent methyltransferase [Paracidovorax konjaci]|uniref:Methyltransferase domain-containing protein n=1 Tax=Paracidovorax konjaci TaxID=32040 RepID=A0A1I1V623_9BURK|nr:class I SAM-dependent methyltransferase [Paracidovorax konjaci]SFD78265.1 Methyltransferase domain-containing protein [Paracidovorax konjaci]